VFFVPDDRLLAALVVPAGRHRLAAALVDTRPVAGLLAEISRLLLGARAPARLAVRLVGALAVVPALSGSLRLRRLGPGPVTGFLGLAHCCIPFTTAAH